MPPAWPRNILSNLDRDSAMNGQDQALLTQFQRQRVHRDAQMETDNTKYNMSRLQESWLKIMRSAKTRQLKKQVDIISQNHERDVDRHDAILQMLDRDLDEAEDQHQVAVRSHLLNVDRLLEIQQSRLLALEDDCNRDMQTLQREFELERAQIQEKHSLEKRELTLIIEQVEKGERSREQADIVEHESQFEIIRNRSIEDDHQMKSGLEEKLEDRRLQCKEKLETYQKSTKDSTELYKELLQSDAKMNKEVERRVRQVTRMNDSIRQCKLKIEQDKQDCMDRNTQLKAEKANLAEHFQELKAKMNNFRSDEKKRFADLTQNARNCTDNLKVQLSLAERILKTAQLCRKFETEREKVLPFYLSREVLTEFEEGNFDFGDDELREEIKREISDAGVDECTYLDMFFKRFNKVKLDHVAIEQEGKRLVKDNLQLRSILKQFLDGVSVNEEVLSQPNPLRVVNGKVNLNHVPVKRLGEKKLYVEAAHHVSNMQFS